CAVARRGGRRLWRYALFAARQFHPGHPDDWHFRHAAAGGLCVVYMGSEREGEDGRWKIEHGRRRHRYSPSSVLISGPMALTVVAVGAVFCISNLPAGPDRGGGEAGKSTASKS